MLKKLSGAIEIADPKCLDEISRWIWSAFASGQISESDSEKLSLALEGRREALRAWKANAASNQRQRRQQPRQSATPYDQRHQRLLKKRRQAFFGAGSIPAAVAAAYTISQLACLNVIFQEIRRNGKCAKSLKEIADLAFCCKRTAQRTIKIASALGHLTITENRVRWNYHLPHVISVGSDPLLRRWVLRRGGDDNAVIPYRNQSFSSVKNEDSSAAVSARIPSTPFFQKIKKKSSEKR